MSYLKEKTKHLVPLIKKAFKENPDTISNLNLLSAYVWDYEGAKDSISFEEFVVGLLEDRFSPQNIIAKVQRMVKWEIAKENESV
jgi:hypothetical protein